jgi:hypothetical protein
MFHEAPSFSLELVIEYALGLTARSSRYTFCRVLGLTRQSVEEIEQAGAKNPPDVAVLAPLDYAPNDFLRIAELRSALSVFVLAALKRITRKVVMREISRSRQRGRAFG